MPKTPTDPLTKITVRLPASLIREAKIHAVQTDQDLQEVVHAALVRYLAKKGMPSVPLAGRPAART